MGVRKREERTVAVQQYQQAVISKLYQAEWDDEDDFFISHINQPQQKQTNRTENEGYTR